MTYPRLTVFRVTYIDHNGQTVTQVHNMAAGVSLTDAQQNYVGNKFYTNVEETQWLVGQSVEQLGECPCCKVAGTINVGCRTCPGFWFSINKADFDYFDQVSQQST